MKIFKQVPGLILLHRKGIRFVTNRCCFSSSRKEELIIGSPFPDIEIPTNVTLPEYLQEKSDRDSWNNRVAFESWENGQKYTFKDVFEMSKSFAQSLLNNGLKKGDIVGIALGNVPEFIPILFGIYEAGLIASPTNPSFTEYELIKQLHLSGARGLIIGEKLKEIAEKFQNGCPELSHIFVLGKENDKYESVTKMLKWDKNAHILPKTVDTRKEVSLLLYSSGTTGLPKGVGLSQFNILSNMLQVTHPNVSRATGINPKMIGILPFFNSFGLNSFVHEGMGTGAHTLCLQKFDHTTFHLLLDHHKPTRLHLVTPLVNHIIQNPLYNKNLFESLEQVNLGAAPTGPLLLKKLLDKFPENVAIREGYGLTEFTSCTHLVPPDSKLDKIGSCGVPVSNTKTKIINPATGLSLQPKKSGEICIKGPQMMIAYWKNPEATEQTVDKDGWFHTGDIGYYDADGYLYIVDRIKDLIKVKGFQVSPSEIEQTLQKHPEVIDVGVCGVEHEKLGQAPRAYIVARTNSLTAEAVHEYLSSRLSPYKQLQGGVEFVSKIPKSEAGKILRKELERMFQNQNSQES